MNPGSTSRARLFLATFAILALELALIRWMSHQVRVFAYLNNVLLMAAFLGMGLGVAVGRRHPRLFHLTLPSLALLAGVLAYSGPLKLMHLGFPDRTITLWVAPAESFVGSLVVIVALFGLVTWVFVCAGTIVGEIFSRSDSLDAYAWDLLGSLAGILAVTALSAYGTPPPAWFAAACVPLALLSRRASSVVAGVAVLALTWLSIDGGTFSPYYRIDIHRQTAITGAPLQLSVNRDFHQYMHDLSPVMLGNPSLAPDARAKLQQAERAYGLPFSLTARRDRALVLGAGTGNDVAAALRRGFRDVVSVDIDPEIIELGRRLHPERPYDDPRVRAVVNDARAYLEQNPDDTFDVVCFGLLDSHAMFSAMSSLRLDNYVYTVESLRGAFAHVRPGGVLTVSFSVGNRRWLFDRILRIVAEASGQKPIAVFHGVQGGVTYIAFQGAPDSARLASLFQPRAAQGFVPMQVLNLRVDPNARPSTDDWPFLYIMPGSIPWGYIAVLAAILLLAVLGTREAFGKEMFESGNFDVPLFFMGAAFLLIETRGVTDLSLLFGSTWIVNAVVFVGVLLTVLAANEFVRRRGPQAFLPFFALLFAALVVNFVVGPGMLLRLDPLARGLAGGILNALPVGFAGVVFSSLLARSKRPDLALGANLLGAVVGGCLEYLSMLTGLRALSLLALCLYLVALLAILRARRVTEAGEPATA